MFRKSLTQIWKFCPNSGTTFRDEGIVSVAFIGRKKTAKLSLPKEITDKIIAGYSGTRDYIVSLDSLRQDYATLTVKPYAVETTVSKLEKRTFVKEPGSTGATELSRNPIIRSRDA